MVVAVVVVVTQAMMPMIGYKYNSTGYEEL
jgi:hypothetical protein